MKKSILVILSVLFLNQHVLAVTLFEALNEAYKNNTDLNAERENINISEEDLKISKSTTSGFVFILYHKLFWHLSSIALLNVGICNL